LGKYYSASANSHAVAQSFTVCIAIGDICVSKSERGRAGVAKSSADSDNVPHCTAGSLRERRALAD
jgi:hypothetical protein